MEPMSRDCAALPIEARDGSPPRRARNKKGLEDEASSPDERMVNYNVWPLPAKEQTGLVSRSPTPSM